MTDVKTADRDLNKLDKMFRPKVDRLLELHPEIFVTEAFRTMERQKHLFSIGRTYEVNKPKVTWVDGLSQKSNHQLGKAIDIAFHGVSLYPKSHSKWASVAKTAKKLGIDWGFDLWKKDKPHFQCNGVPLKENLKGDYQKLMEKEVPSNERVFTVYDYRDPLVENKALMEIGLYRSRKRLISDISKKGLDSLSDNS